MGKKERIQSFGKLDSLVRCNGITYYRLAKETGISTSVFYEWKKGRSAPKADKLLKIAKYFGVKIEYFVTGGD